MAEYVKPALFADKVPQGAQTQQSDLTDASAAHSEPDTADHVSARENPVFDVEAQRAASRQVSSARLPALIGPTTAWSPVETESMIATSLNGSTFTASQAPLPPVQPQQSADNALFVQPLLAGT